MNIYTVRDNLIRTIGNKEDYLSQTKVELRALDELEGAGARGQAMALQATVEFLKLNIKELSMILEDVKKCCEKATEDSWLKNPDRSGGQFTQEEVDNANRW